MGKEFQKRRPCITYVSALPVLRRAKELGMGAIPGAMTPAEVAEAYREGADMVKLFPCLTSITGELLNSITNDTIIADAVGHQFVSMETKVPAP